MGTGFGVEAHQIGARLGEGLRQGVHGLHHQVHVDGRRAAIGEHGMGLERLAHHRPEGQVGHVMVVHHVEMDPVCAGGQDVADLLAQASEIGRQDGRGNAVGAHGASLRSSA